MIGWKIFGEVSEVAKLMAGSGVTAITALFRHIGYGSTAGSRDRSATPVYRGFFVDAPLEVCEARDPKNISTKRAQVRSAGTGIDAL